MTARPDTGTGRDTRAHVAAGRHPHADRNHQEDPMSSTSTQPADQPMDAYHALLAERYGPIADISRERAAPPAELIRLPQRRRAERKAAA